MTDITSNELNQITCDCEYNKKNNDSKIATVEEYLEEIDNVYRKFWGNRPELDILKYSPKIWCRGVKSSDYSMLPSIARRSLNVEYETMFLSKFKSKAIPYLRQMPSYPYAENLHGYLELVISITTLRYPYAAYGLV